LTRKLITAPRGEVAERSIAAVLKTINITFPLSPQ
jgi:hypothetical protein